MSDTESTDIVEMTADLVSAYVSNNSVPVSELPALISQIHHSLASLSERPAVAADEPQKPAGNPKRSVHDDYIVSLEDGRKFKRHPRRSTLPLQRSAAPAKRSPDARRTALRTELLFI